MEANEELTRGRTRTRNLRPVIVMLMLMLIGVASLSAGAAFAGLPASKSATLVSQAQGKSASGDSHDQGVTANNGTGQIAAAIPPAAPVAPNVVLYDQYNNDGNNSIVSSNRTDNAALTSETADDLVVPSGVNWNITEVDVRGNVAAAPQNTFNVRFYQNTGTLPGTMVYEALNLAFSGTNLDIVIPLTTAAVLTTGTYWVSVQDNISGANWYWEMRAVQSNSPAAFREGGGFGTGCNAPAWFNRGTCTTTTSTPDQMFRLMGTAPTQGTPTRTATPTACPPGQTYNVAATTGTIVLGTTDTGNHCDECTNNITLPFPVSLYGQSFTTA
ncbi:MAG: hypothetical protein M3014_01560, partial [Chloroflexota bacterium]|nr:hypothetical protein [Chloroflexota bacterium]